MAKISLPVAPGAAVVGSDQNIASPSGDTAKAPAETKGSGMNWFLRLFRSGSKPSLPPQAEAAYPVQSSYSTNGGATWQQFVYLNGDVVQAYVPIDRGVRHQTDPLG